jgi:hypothetical protein
MDWRSVRGAHLVGSTKPIARLMQPFQGSNVTTTVTQGSSCLATLEWNNTKYGPLGVC